MINSRTKVYDPTRVDFAAMHDESEVYNTVWDPRLGDKQIPIAPEGFTNDWRDGEEDEEVWFFLVIANVECTQFGSGFPCHVLMIAEWLLWLLLWL